MSASGIDIRPSAAAIGAEIHGVYLRQPLDNETWAAILDAFHEYLVVFFRDQDLSADQHAAFAERFGQLVPFPYVQGIEGHPSLIDVVKTPSEVHNFGSGWHADMSFTAEPPLGAVLRGIEVPPKGGDTMFANMYLAYELLSDGMKALVERTRGVHDPHDPIGHTQRYEGMSLLAREGEARQIHHHSLVKVHPVTGRKSLFISPDYCMQLEDMTEEESHPLVDYLERHATSHALTCRFHWAPNSIAVWDNRCTMHNALEDDLGARMNGHGFRRVMRRATIQK
jgi:taurine dioxygenase